MKQQIKLTLKEVATLAIDRLISQGELVNKRTDVDWYFDTWKLSDGYIVISQED